MHINFKLNHIFWMTEFIEPLEVCILLSALLSRFGRGGAKLKFRGARKLFKLYVTKHLISCSGSGTRGEKKSRGGR